MADSDSYKDNKLVDTDVFVVVENEDDTSGFVFIDDDTLSAPIIIDMSDDEFVEAITIDFEGNTGFDDFVTIDETPIFISGFDED